MSYEFVKQCAKMSGVYRQLRWLNRRTLNRQELAAFRAERAFYAKLIRPGDLCFDVGANYGFKTEVFLSLNARVIAFEPQEDCLNELKARNPQAAAIQSAVGAVEGTATMRVDPFRTGSSLLPAWRSEIERVVSVPVTTLDSAIRQWGHPNYCKVDVEGFEEQVFAGLSVGVPLVSFEFTRSRMSDAMNCLESLSRFGIAEYNVTPADQPTFWSTRWLSRGELQSFLSDAVKNLPGYDWGDIFVRALHPT